MATLVTLAKVVTFVTLLTWIMCCLVVNESSMLLMLLVLKLS